MNPEYVLTFQYDYKDSDELLDEISHELFGETSDISKVGPNNFLLSKEEKTYLVDIYELDKNIKVHYRLARY